MVYKKNRQSQAIIFNDSTISSHLQGKLKPTGPFQPKIAQTLKILLIKPTFLPPKHAKHHPNRWTTEGERPTHKGGSPDKRGWIRKVAICLIDLRGAYPIIADFIGEYSVPCLLTYAVGFALKIPFERGIIRILNRSCHLAKAHKQRTSKFHISPSRIGMKVNVGSLGSQDLALFNGIRASRFGADLDNRISVNLNKKAFVVAPLTGNDCDMFQGPKLIPIGGLYTRLISHLHWWLSKTCQKPSFSCLSCPSHSVCPQK